MQISATDSTCVKLFGVTATIAHRTNYVERARRYDCGLTHLDSMELLDVLMELPVGVPVPVSSISPPDRRILAKAPAGTVRTTLSTVIRLAEPVVTPTLAVVYAARWRQGLEDASEFASYIPRMLVIGKLPTNTGEALAEAAWYGIGVAVGQPSKCTMILPPEPLADWQPTVAWWRFCERVYGHAVVEAT